MNAVSSRWLSCLASINHIVQQIRIRDSNCKKMVRAPYFDKNGTKKGAWSDEEDEKLKAYMEIYGHGNWRQIPKLAGLSRCGKSCRLRWVNYLRPNVKRGNYTSEEEDLIINLHRIHGSRWSMIAAKLPGRSDNEIKNHWHTHLRKRTTQNIDLSYSKNENVQMNLEDKEDKSVVNLLHCNEREDSEIKLADLCSKSSSDVNNKQPSLLAYNGTYHNSNSSLLSYSESFEDFWNKPFLPDTFNGNSNEYSTSYTDLVDRYASSSNDIDTIMVDAYLWTVMELCGS